MTFQPSDTVISQYSQSPTILALIDFFNDYANPGADFNAFYSRVMNIATAVGYGLDVWGRIVGVSRVVAVANFNYFGFEEALPGSEPFNQGAFYSGETLTQNFALADPDYRMLIFAKAASNISNGSIPSINQILLNLFPGLGNCYVTDGENMTMTYTFDFILTPVQLAVISQSGVLPKPAGVSVSIVQI